MNCMNSLQVFQFSCFYHLGWLVLCRRHRCSPPHVGLRFCRMQAAYVTDSSSPRLLVFFFFWQRTLSLRNFKFNNLVCMGTKIFLMFLFINSLTSKAINSIMSKLPYHFLLRKQYCPSCVIFSGYYKKKSNKIKNYPEFPISNYLHHMQLSGGLLALLIACSAK